MLILANTTGTYNADVPSVITYQNPPAIVVPVVPKTVNIVNAPGSYTATIVDTPVYQDGPLIASRLPAKLFAVTNPAGTFAASQLVPPTFADGPVIVIPVPPKTVQVLNAAGTYNLDLAGVTPVFAAGLNIPERIVSGTMLLTNVDGTYSGIIALPKITAFQMPTHYHSLDIPVNMLTGDSRVTQFAITTSPVEPTDWLNAPPNMVTVNSADVYTFYAWGKSATGEVSAAAIQTVIVPMFYYTGVQNGTTTAKLYTNDPDYPVSVSDIGKFLYLNDTPYGRITAVTDLPNCNLTLEHYNASGVLDSSTPAGGKNLKCIEITTNMPLAASAVTSATISSQFTYQYNDKIYTNDPKIINVTDNSLQGVNLTTSKTGYTQDAVVLSNKLFDGNSSQNPTTINGVNVKGLVLQEITINKTQPIIQQPAQTAIKYYIPNQTDPVNYNKVYQNNTYVNQTGVSVLSVAGTSGAVTQTTVGYGVVQPTNLYTYVGGLISAPAGGNYAVSGGTGYVSSGGTGYMSYGNSAFATGPITSTVGYIAPTGLTLTQVAGSYLTTGTPLSAGTAVATTNGTVLANGSGLLPAGTTVYTASGTAVVGSNGLLPPNTTYATPAGTVTTNSQGELPPNTTVVATNGTITSTSTGVLPADTVVLTPSGTVIADENGLLPAGVNISISLGSDIVIAEGVNGLVGKRLIVNEVYLGVVVSNTLNSITINAPIGHSIREVNGIWRMETVDNVGRIPLCTCSQIAVANYPEYPRVNVAACNYTDDYTANLSYFPDATDLFAIREEGQINIHSVERVQRHVFPAWVEHLHVQPDGQFMLADDPTAEVDDPYCAYYVKGFNEFDFKTLWLWGKEVRINRSAIYPMVDYNPSGVTWEGHTSHAIKAIAYENIPGSLSVITMQSVNPSVDKIFLAGAAVMPTYRGLFDSTQFYALLAVVVSGGDTYIKTSSAGEVYLGEYSDTWLYSIGDVVTMPDGAYAIFDGGSFVPYIGAITASWQLVNTRGYYDAMTSYNMYDLVIDITNGQSYITLTDDPGAPSIDTAWFRLAIQDAGIVTLCTGGVFEHAASPVRVSISGSVIEKLSIDDATVIFLEIATLEHVAVLGNDITLQQLYTPNTAPALTGRSGLLGTQVLEKMMPVVSLNIVTSSITAPTVTASAGILSTVTPTKAGTTIQLKRGMKANLPAAAAVGEPVVTLDTAELYVGTGTGLRKISDVIVSETEPDPVDRNKLWYNPAVSATYVYKDGTWQITNAEATLDYGTF